MNNNNEFFTKAFNRLNGDYQFNQLENTFYKWTNPFFWIWAVFYGAFVFVKSLFVTNKDFKK